MRAAVLRGTSPSPGDTAILARSNVTVFSEAVQLTIRNPKTRIHFVGVSELETDDGRAVFLFFFFCQENEKKFNRVLHAEGDNSAEWFALSYSSCHNKKCAKTNPKRAA